MFSFAAAPRRRRPSLTPMIDVVFLLLVFFMLAARFGQVGALSLVAGTGAAAEWQGAPRLIDLTPEGVRLNGVAIARDELPGALRLLMPAPDAPVLLRALPGADLGHLAGMLDLLARAGFPTVILVE
jgi:biopolymer transport protein ExbD